MIFKSRFNTESYLLSLLSYLHSGGTTMFVTLHTLPVKLQVNEYKGGTISMFFVLQWLLHLVQQSYAITFSPSFHCIKNTVGNGNKHKTLLLFIEPESKETVHKIIQFIHFSKDK